MTTILAILVVILVLALAAVWGGRVARRGGTAPAPRAPGARRILFPFVANALSARALDAALRLANAENATLVPIFLARVPLHLPLDTALPRQCAMAISLQDVIEQRATAFGVPVDARIERGRTYRHALRQALTNERFDRIVIAAATHQRPGFNPDDVRWMLDNAPGEIVVLRPSDDERLTPPTPRAKPWARKLTRTRHRHPAAVRAGQAANR
jgi:hypothetical protein